MSLQSFLSKIWTSIEKIFNSLESKLKDAVHIGVLITANINNFVFSPAADVLTAIIPGDLDDKIKQLLRAKLPHILTQLKLVDTTAELTDPDEIVRYAVMMLQTLDGDIRSAFLHNLSVMIAQVAADGKLSWADGVYILQWYYQHQFEKP